MSLRPVFQRRGKNHAALADPKYGRTPYSREKHSRDNPRSFRAAQLEKTDDLAPRFKIIALPPMDLSVLRLPELSIAEPPEPYILIPLERLPSGDFRIDLGHRDLIIVLHDLDRQAPDYSELLETRVNQTLRLGLVP